MIDILDRNLYRETKIKKYSVVLYMPPIGTILNNKATTKDEPFAVIEPDMYITICGLNYLKDHYLISSDLLNNKVKTMVDKNTNIEYSVIEPFKIEAKPGKSVIAMRVPSDITFKAVDYRGNITIVNRQPCSCGDYLVCENTGNRINAKDIYVVPGKLFPVMYNMKNFSNMSITSDRKGITLTKIKAPGMDNLIPIKMYSNNKPNDTYKVNTIFMKFMEAFKFEMNACKVPYRIIDNTNNTKLNLINQYKADSIIKSYEIQSNKKRVEIQLIESAKEFKCRFRTSKKCRVTEIEKSQFVESMYWIIDILIDPNIEI